MLKVSLYGAGEGFGFQAAGIRFGTTKLTEWAAKRGAEIARGFFDTNGPNGSWQPLHEFTKEHKSTEQTLIESRDLVDSIQAVQTGPRTWSVVAYDKKAPLHEYGAKIKVTPKMRGYLTSTGFHLKDDTAYVIIPARRFMRPAADQLERELNTKMLQGKMGDWLVPIRGVEKLA